MSIIKYEAPEGYVYYNGGHFLARVVFAVEGNGLKWVLLSREQAEKIDLDVDDGLDYSYWDNQQQYGEREDYSYAFCNSSYTVLAPRHIINANKVMYMFMGCVKLADAGNILIHITSPKPNMMYVCANCISMKRPPIFNFINVPIVKTYTSMYAGCVELEEVSVYWGDGTADPITERSSCQNMFYRCNGLINTDFGEEETGSPIYLDLSWSKNLTVESMRNLLKSLKTIDKAQAESERSVHEVTISPNTYSLLETEAPDVLTGFAGKGWTILTKERNESEEKTS